MAKYDENLATEQFPEMNANFYRSAPHAYLDRRITSLMLMVSDSPKIAEAIRDGIQFGRLQSHGDGEHDPDEARTYAVVESVVVLHHAAEALLRLYFAHRDRPLCPWLDVARLRSPGRFKTSVDEFVRKVDTEDEVQRILNVFMGNYDHSVGFVGFSEATWSSQTEGLKMLLLEAARRVLDEAPMYNAAKHGLAVLPFEISSKVRFGEEGDDQSIEISNNGPSLTFLDILGPKDNKRWVQSLTWVDAEANVALASVISLQIETLWKIARMRYLPGDHDPVSFYTVDPEMIKAITTDTWTKPIHSPGFSETLYYYKVEDV